MGASQNRSDWDNLSSSLTYTDSTRTSSYAHSSPDTCRAACDIRAKCVQFVHEPNKCRLGTTVRFGEAVPSDKHMNSGWLLHRVEKFAQNMGICPTGDAFFIPGPEQPKEPDLKPPEDLMPEEPEELLTDPAAVEMLEGYAAEPAGEGQ
jgi:hypothetical protein